MTKTEYRIGITGAVLLGIGFATAFLLGNTAANIAMAGALMVGIPMIRDAIRQDKDIVTKTNHLMGGA